MESFTPLSNHQSSLAKNFTLFLLESWPEELALWCCAIHLQRGCFVYPNVQICAVCVKCLFANDYTLYLHFTQRPNFFVTRFVNQIWKQFIVRYTIMWIVTQELLGKYDCNLRMLLYLPALGSENERDFQRYRQVHFSTEDLNKSRNMLHTSGSDIWAHLPKETTPRKNQECWQVC